MPDPATGSGKRASPLLFRKVMGADPSQYQESFFNFESQSISASDSNFEYLGASQLLYPQVSRDTNLYEVRGHKTAGI